MSTKNFGLSALLYVSKLILTRSILVTVAPKSDKTIPQYGPGASPANSMTRIPFSAIVNVNLVCYDQRFELNSNRHICKNCFTKPT